MKVFRIIALGIALSFIAFIGYGLATQCEDVAIYQYCGDE